MLTAISFLHGLAAEELREQELKSRTPGYEVIVTVRAVKPGAVDMSTRALRQIARWLSKRPSESVVVVLVYHRVAKARSDPWSLAVTPEHFAEHLEALRQHAVPLRLQQLSRALAKGATLPGRSVVVTFDDGYADNLHNAKPLLERYGIPATIFLTSGFIGSGNGFWWDELDRLLLRPGRLPKNLRLNINGKTRRWQLGDAARYPRAEFRRHRRWRAWEDARHLATLCTNRCGDSCTARQTRSSERYFGAPEVGRSGGGR